MRARTLAAALTLFTLFAAGRVAFADAKSELSGKLKSAMEAYDSFDYDGAKKTVQAAITAAKNAHLDKDPTLARAYVDLGIIDFAIPDQAAAKEAFVSACQIDPKSQIDVAYKSPDLAKLLDQARAQAAKSGPPSSGGGDDIDSIINGSSGDTSNSSGGGDCSSVKGLQHDLVDSAKGGRPLQMTAQLGGDVKAAKVSLMYRIAGASMTFTEVKMTASGCTYTGSIPASALKGGMIHYYIAAYDGSGKVLASRGSAGSPNIIEVTAGSGGGSGPSDDEDPLGGHKQVAQVDNGGGPVDEGPHNTDNGPRKMKRVWIGVNGGTGTGYVTGNTEGGDVVKTCCFGEDPVLVLGEIGVNLTPQLAIGAAFRMSLPLGANMPGHSTGAPGGLLRVHYAISHSGDGVHVQGQLGYGFLRNTIKLEQNMGTDIVAQGPLLLGAGVGYGHALGSVVKFTADLNVLAGLAVVNQIGLAPMNNGVSIDLSIGFLFGLF